MNRLRRDGRARVALTLVVGWLCLCVRLPAADGDRTPRRYAPAWERQATRDASTLVERGTLRRRPGAPVAVNLERRINQSLERAIRAQAEAATRIQQQRDRSERIQERQEQIRKQLQENRRRRQDQRRELLQQEKPQRNQSTRDRAASAVALRRVTADPVSAVSQRRISAVGTQSGTDGTGNTTATIDTPLLDALVREAPVVRIEPDPAPADVRITRDKTRTITAAPVVSDTPVRTVDKPSISVTPRPAPQPVPPPTDVVDTPPKTPTRDTPPIRGSSR